jgi:hemerythrin-like metal-binding protein
MSSTKLVWEDKYNIVKEIDEQHKHLFEIINDLIEIINSQHPKDEDIAGIINKIVEYKAMHFATEERHFHEFNFEGTLEHEARHREFNQKVSEIQQANQGNAIAFAFALVDFLEDWLVNHLMNMDQKYKKCFNDHGLY